MVSTFGARVGPSEPGAEPLEAAPRKLGALESLESCIVWGSWGPKWKFVFKAVSTTEAQLSS